MEEARFEDLGLCPEIMKAVKNMDWNEGVTNPGEGDSGYDGGKRHHRPGPRPEQERRQHLEFPCWKR